MAGCPYHTQPRASCGMAHPSIDIFPYCIIKQWVTNNILSFYFSGAIGSTLLAYIMPCIIHLKLHGRALSTPIIIKDAVVIVFGVAGGVASVFASTLAIFGRI